MRIGLSGGGTTTTASFSRRSRPRPTASRACGIRVRSSAIRSSPWQWRAVPQRPSSSAPRCCRPTPVTPCSRRTVPRRPRRRWDGQGSRSAFGPSHQPVIEGAYGLSYDGVRSTHRGVRHGARHAARGEGVALDGEHFHVHIPITSALPQPVSVMVSTLAPRLLRVAGERHRRHDPLDGKRPGHRDARRAP